MNTAFIDLRLKETERIKLDQNYSILNDYFKQELYKSNRYWDDLYDSNGSSLPNDNYNDSLNDNLNDNLNDSLNDSLVENDLPVNSTNGFNP